MAAPMASNSLSINVFEAVATVGFNSQPRFDEDLEILVQR
jgi:hypothetical protein